MSDIPDKGTMARLLFTVEDTFLIEGRGLVPVPGIIPQGDERFRVGDPIKLMRPDGSEIEWQIAGLEFICPPPRQDEVVLLLKGLDKRDVPIGTEVWSIDRSARPTVPRYFVAIPFPDEARDRLLAVQPPAAPGMRLLGREEFHLTLHFLGEVGPQDIEKVRAALATVKMLAFTVDLKGIGKFPPEGQPKVLWAGIESKPPLLALHSLIGTALTDAIGFRPEERPYSPHLTLARLNMPVPPDVIDRYLKEHKNFMVSSMLLDRFGLYSSRFADNVPKYQEEAAFPLDVL